MFTVPDICALLWRRVSYVLSDFTTDFNVYTCIDLPITNAPYIFLLITITVLRDYIFVCQNHSVELWINYVTLLIINFFLIMFH